MRTLGLGICVIAVLAVSALLDRESGIGIWSELRDDLAVSAARVERLARENEAMRREIAMLEAEPAALDRAIREELDMAMPGEIVVRFTSTAAHPELEEPASEEGDWSLREALFETAASREAR